MTKRTKRTKRTKKDKKGREGRKRTKRTKKDEMFCPKCNITVNTNCNGNFNVRVNWVKLITSSLSWVSRYTDKTESLNCIQFDKLSVI